MIQGKKFYIETVMETSKYKLTYKTIVMTLNFYLMHYLFTGAWASPSSSSLRALTKHYLDSMSSHYSCDSVNSSESEDLESLESVKMKLLETKKTEFNKEPLLKEKRKLNSMKSTTRKTSLKNMIIHIVDISHINLVLPQVDSLSSCNIHVDYLYLLGVLSRDVRLISVMVAIVFDNIDNLRKYLNQFNVVNRRLLLYIMFLFTSLVTVGMDMDVHTDTPDVDSKIDIERTKSSLIITIMFISKLISLPQNVTHVRDSAADYNLINSHFELINYKEDNTYAKMTPSYHGQSTRVQVQPVQSRSVREYCDVVAGMIHMKMTFGSMEAYRMDMTLMLRLNVIRLVIYKLKHSVL